MQEEKIEQLLSLIHELILVSNDLEFNDFSRTLREASSRLRSKDLVGFQIISLSIKKSIESHESSNHKFLNLRQSVKNYSAEIKEEYDKNLISLTQAEKLFLNLSYNKFWDISSEIYSHTFWERSPEYRFQKISQAFALYSEMLNHAPFKGVLKWISEHRPPMESEISGPLFKFIRNVLAHFPFFDTWDEIWISKELANWERPNQSIDRFLTQHIGRPEVEYRFKQRGKKGFSYVKIRFPKKYDNERIYIKDIIVEEEGLKFALAMMLKVLYTQVEAIK